MEKAINNTTVEVTFDEEVDNLKALDFAIEGLEITNAAIKQTNKKVVVLTTSAQTADVEYTVTLNDEKIGSFKGIGSVVPTSIKLLTTNTQAKVGNQVTLKADVGVKAAGVPVTFNVDAPTGSLNKDAVVEVFTDAEGIATYSYTQYAPDADDVTVYPTGAPQLRSFATVYWGVDNILALEEVTTGNVQPNGVKKTYKLTYKDPKTGAPLANRDLNVSFVENTNVAFNAISKATVTNPTTNVTVTPYQATSGLFEEIKVKTDSNGQATFVVSGTNTAVTPYVFVDGSSSVLGAGTVTGTGAVTTAATANKKWEATELTATAAQVKFEGAQLNHRITVERAGEEEAAAVYGSKLNGREYKVKILDKDGKPYANGLVNIGLDEVLDRNLNTSSKANFSNVKDSSAFTPNVGTSQQGKIKLDSKGEATVVLSGAKGEVGTPVVWIDQNTSQNNQTGVLEDGEPFFKAPISNFQYERVIGADFQVEGKDSNQNVGTDGIANYTFALTNQSGKALDRLNGKLTYEIRNTSGQPIVVKTPINYRDQNNVSASSFQIEEYGSITITADVLSTSNAAFTVETAPNGKSATVVVTPSFVTVNNFDASGDNGITTDVRDFNKYVTATGLTATFGNSSVIDATHTGYISTYNTSTKEIRFVGKNAVKYAGQTGKTYEYYGTNGAPIYGETAFITALENAAGAYTNAATGVRTNALFATYKIDGDVIKFYLENNTSPVTTTSPAVTKENVPAVPGKDGTIRFTNGSTTVTSVNYTQPLTIEVNDADFASNTVSGETLTVSYTLTDGANAGTHTITLTEATDTGVFSAVVPVALYQGATAISAIYTDAKTVATTVQTRTASATISQILGTVSQQPGPIVAYSDGATPAKLVTGVVAGSGASTSVAAQTVKLTIGSVENDIVIPALTGTEAQNAAAIAALINTAFGASASNPIAIVVGAVGSETIEITATNKTDIIKSALTLDNTAGFAQSGATANPGTGTPVAAVWAFDVTNNFAAGEKLTVAIGGSSKTVTIAGSGDAAEIFALLTANGLTGYTVANTGTRITITQNTPAVTTGTTLSVTTSK